jgi:two-component system CitB family sensor kinase
VIGVGLDGKMTLLNQTATELLELPANSAGALVKDLPLDAPLRSLLLETTNGEETVAVTGSRLLVLNRRTIGSRGRPMGTRPTSS